jgi:hypothetical protein
MKPSHSATGIAETAHIRRLVSRLSLVKQNHLGAGATIAPDTLSEDLLAYQLDLACNWLRTQGEELALTLRYSPR